MTGQRVFQNPLLPIKTTQNDNARGVPKPFAAIKSKLHKMTMQRVFQNPLQPNYQTNAQNGPKCKLFKVFAARDYYVYNYL